MGISSSHPQKQGLKKPRPPRRPPAPIPKERKILTNQEQVKVLNDNQNVIGPESRITSQEMSDNNGWEENNTMENDDATSERVEEDYESKSSQLQYNIAKDHLKVNKTKPNLHWKWYIKKKGLTLVYYIITTTTTTTTNNNNKKNDSSYSNLDSFLNGVTIAAQVTPAFYGISQQNNRNKKKQKKEKRFKIGQLLREITHTYRAISMLHNIGTEFEKITTLAKAKCYFLKPLTMLPHLLKGGPKSLLSHISLSITTNALLSNYMPMLSVIITNPLGCPFCSFLFFKKNKLGLRSCSDSFKSDEKMNEDTVPLGSADQATCLNSLETIVKKDEGGERREDGLDTYSAAQVQADKSDHAHSIDCEQADTNVLS
ncbi:hypothetical protein RFI_28455 [Reticulomyxa filosa]|uniref:Uncharacterized protein n=1 Tax=Reticulomyxa filosa TaxID=46433 RepID=X6M5P3_RETFI|nr:hypothetical protein RFI_28455 [Reticulomyxa filosa]|eukprot:ETO08931.1 hypothetical protein RFI_28455 [Reticulomyxa filosa]